MKTLEHTALIALATLVAAVMPSIALACPACAFREDGGTAVLVGQFAMMGLPFLIFGGVVYGLKKVAKEEQDNFPASHDVD